MIIVIILNFAVRNPGDKRPGGEFGNARENDYVAALDSHSGASAPSFVNLAAVEMATWP
mgnify:CR=1 FL=1